VKRDRKTWSVASIALWSILCVALAVILLLAVKRPGAVQPEASAEKPVPVRTLRIEGSRLDDVLLVPGVVEPHADVTLSAERAGTVKELSVERGSRVRAGDVLARVDDRTWRSILDRARIEAADAARERARWEELARTGAVSTSDLDRVVLRDEVAAVAVDEAEVNVRRCELQSPVDGAVEERYVEAGEYVTEGQPVVRVVTTDRLKVVANIPERDIASVSEGMRIPFNVQSLPDGSFTGTVTFVSVAGSRQSNCFEIEVEVDPGGLPLRPGMIAELSMTRRVWEHAIVIPLSAAVPRKGEHIAFVVAREGGKTRAEARVLRIERIVGTRALVGSGLAEGDELVIEGHRGLQDGLLIEIQAGRHHEADGE
jgi:membrane fusion protein (multidrug efflux system)